MSPTSTTGRHRGSRDADPCRGANALGLMSHALSVVAGAAGLIIAVFCGVVALRETPRSGQTGRELAMAALVICAVKAPALGWAAYQQFAHGQHVDWTYWFKPAAIPEPPRSTTPEKLLRNSNDDDE
jgi:hypothetical protein